LLAAWILFCAFCNSIGWILSGLDELNTAGYAVAFGLAFLALIAWKVKTKAVFFPPRSFSKLRGRFSKPFPLAFLILGALALLGGVLHGPSNYDGLAYRTPRVLQWLSASHWHWIHTDFNRLNTRGSAFEWLTAPLFALARTDRFEFLVNIICIALLPGRIFSIWIRLGVRPRMAWYWMWLLPTGYCYLLQAGSIANDMFGALLALAAVEFALRACRSGQVHELLLGFLAAGLMTSSKAFNLLLLLPWAIAAAPALGLLVRRPLISLFTLLVAGTVSLIPTAVSNYRNCGDWTGQKAEHLTVLGTPSPVFHFGVNSFLVVLHNFEPPVFPFSSAWEHLVQRTVPPTLSARLHQTFEPAAADFKIVEMQMEESAGLGIGLSALLLATIIYRWRYRSRTDVAREHWYSGLLEARWLVPLGALVGVFIFMAQNNLGCPARYLSPFYPLVIAPVLAGAGPWLRVVRQLWWQRAAAAVFLVAGLLLVLSPPRPLWPAVTTLKAFGADKSSSLLVRRAWTVYSVFGERADAFAPALEVLPHGTSPLGLVTSDDPEASLWYPFGSRRVEHVCKSDGPEYLRERDIKYVLVSSNVLTHLYEMTIDEWLKKYNAEIVDTLSLSLRAATEPSRWWLVRVRD
jgi:hypothetical protein